MEIAGGTQLIEKYLELGGQRRIYVEEDGSIRVFTLDPEPEAAARFWEENIAVLDIQGLNNLYRLLPLIQGLHGGHPNGL
ncbi:MULTISPECIES: hypothetical protein [Agrobacterium]|uniref:hypothetical protein n=1 Tax=Agrobacterium TaxID=357 RepID=UPI000DD39E20|nr:MULTISPECIES: hypothetical protein [Agrobacterium]MBO9108020.1 hypothetical protein [Agrobacterium sp. S2/73]NTA15249.1 hypothetical protein [Agrobacterium tumefaciens]NTA80180.1 hypothetical protein [Agrobacterium tumefaciens]QXZ71387.1 hypothetical protein J5276_09725 [Agrobacterium sp. S7/73]WCK71486.1 hypothetical protein G6L96_003190 [Agrobacterium tumefaciens]